MLAINFASNLEKIKAHFPKILSSHAGFAQLQLNLHDRFFASGGFRQDSHNTFGDATTYRVTGAYLLKETSTKIRSSYSTGFRAPDINELFFPNFGNPNLKAEKSQSFEVGLDQHFFEKRLKLSVGYFWSRFRQLIATTFDPVGCAPFLDIRFLRTKYWVGQKSGVGSEWCVNIGGRAPLYEAGRAEWAIYLYHHA